MSTTQLPDLELKLDLMRCAEGLSQHPAPELDGWGFSGLAYSAHEEAAELARGLPGYHCSGPGERVHDLASFVLDADTARDLVLAVKKLAASHPHLCVAITTACSRAVPGWPAPWPQEEQAAYRAALAWVKGEAQR